MATSSLYGMQFARLPYNFCGSTEKNHA